MNRHRQSATWLGAVVGTVCALLVLTLAAHASDRGSITEEFHQTYALTADGRVELENINGDVHITTWDQNQVKVDAVKYADSKETLDDAKIEIDSNNNSIAIRTRYPEHNHHSWNDRTATVDYTLTVPRTARLDEIKLINGELNLAGVKGEVRASCINGRLEAKNLEGNSRLSTINGKLDARFDRLSGRSVELNSVNGSVDLTIPSDSNAEVEANTVSGGIENDFGLHVNRHMVGHDLRGEIGSGATRIELHNVNGHVEIHRAQDGRAMSPVKDLGHRTKDDDDSI